MMKVFPLKQRASIPMVTFHHNSTHDPLQTADTVVGHNIISFDLPIIKRLYPFFTYPPVIVDTLLLSRLYHPNLS